MTLPDPPPPLAQSTDFEIGETFIINASLDEDDICYESDNVFIKVHDFDMTLTGRSYVDVVITVPASPDMVDNISPNPFEAPHVSPLYSLPCHSPKCHNMSHVNFHDVLEGNMVDCVESLGNFSGYDPSFDPYSLYLGNMPVKIFFTIPFNHCTDFSKACDKSRRTLTIISRFMFKSSYSHLSELHTQVFDKLL